MIADKAAVKIEYAGVAQPVEQLIRNQQVACSSHVSSSTPQRFVCGVFGLCRPFPLKTETPWEQIRFPRRLLVVLVQFRTDLCCIRNSMMFSSEKK